MKFTLVIRKHVVMPETFQPISDTLRQASEAVDRTLGFHHGTNRNQTSYWILPHKRGIDFTKIQYPTIRGKLVNEEDRVWRITILPNLIYIIFFSTVAMIFMYFSIFSDNWTINGVRRLPTVGERILFIAFGSVMPLSICYFTAIKTISEADRWFTKTFGAIVLP